MKKLFLFSLFWILAFRISFSQKSDTTAHIVDQKAVYSFIIQDAPARLFTMRQFNQLYVSGYRLFSRMLDRNLSPVLSYVIQGTTYFFAFGPMTHEEGHRSILIAHNIGSISQPFFLSKRGGYIDGVTDQTLQNLRDNKFPEYIRLYTAGLESDYMLTHREESLFAFGSENFKNLAIEYLFRKAAILQYYLMIFIKHDIDGAEEPDELKRDIVGNDVYGAIRHLHRPDMPFHRYTQYKDLTPEEVNYARKMGYRSLLNLVNPNIIGIENFTLWDNLKFSAGLGHTMCPFGDFTDENIWLMFNEKIKLSAYMREFENRNNWFPAGGIGIEDLPLAKRFTTSLKADIWNEPVNLGFNETTGKTGGAITLTGSYFLRTNQSTRLKALSVDLGFIYKTSGYLPEEIIMKRHFGIHAGTSFALDR